MKDGELRGLTASRPPAAGNGTHVQAKKNGAGSKRSSTSGTLAGAWESQQMAAEFAVLDAEPVDAPMWPLHPTLWFQPELKPTDSIWSGLVIEHHNRIPAPDFMAFDIVPLNCPGTTDSPRAAFTPDARRVLPQSGLAPLGWDPRTVCRKEGGE
jgi:hypothetical protein